MSWAANEGFSAFMDQFNYQYASSHEFRQRHVLKLLASRK